MPAAQVRQMRAASTPPRATTRAPAECLPSAPATRTRRARRRHQSTSYSVRPIDAEPRVLGTNRRIVEPRRHRMRRQDVAGLVLQQQAARAVQHAGHAAGESRRVFARRDAAPAGFHAHQPHAASSMNASKRPIALLPPPTQATARSGSRPDDRRACPRAPPGRSPTGTRAPSADTGCGPSAEPSE